MNELHKNDVPVMVPRAVLYARVSSDDRGKDGRNLAGQLDMCREYAQQHGWSIVAELEEDDRGASGASFDLPRLNQVLEMAEVGEFDVLVVREIDRLSRRLAKQLIVEEELRRAGVQIEYVLADYDETPEGQFMKNVRAVVAEYERVKIAERMIRGRRQKVRAGHIMTFARRPYGYELAKVDGKVALVVHEPEARVVRSVFSWYAHGDEEGATMSLADIARKLTSMGIPTRGDENPRLHAHKKRGKGEWARGTVHYMLKNETYVGIWRYGKTRGPRNGRRERTKNEDQIPVRVPRIVPDEVWAAVQNRLEANRRNAMNRRRKFDYLLSTRVTCGMCGVKMAGGANRPAGDPRALLYYRCPTQYQKTQYARDCGLPSFRADQVDALVWEWVSSFLQDPQVLERGPWEVRQEREKENLPLHDRLAVVEDTLADKGARLERALDLHLSGEWAKEMLHEHRVRLQAEIAELKKERAGLVTHLEAQTLTTEQIVTIQEFARRVRKGLAATTDDFVARRRLIEQLDVQATLSMNDGHRTLFIRCIVGEGSGEMSNNTKGARCLFGRDVSR